MNILDITVSGFKNYNSTQPQDVKLMAWLTSDKYQKQVDEIRATDNKNQRDLLKKVLPAITPSGIFLQRKASELVKHTGLLQFDVDTVNDIEKTKAKICAFKNVAYCGLSVSGRGLWGLIPIAEPQHHRQYFEFIEKAFAKMGITIDPACKDVSRLRGYSYDPDAYFNPQAEPLAKYFQKAVFKPFLGHSNRRPTHSNEKAISAVHHTQTGQRWATVQKAAFTAGGFQDDSALTQIINAIESNPAFLGQERKYIKCARDCFEAGQLKPFQKNQVYTFPIYKPSTQHIAKKHIPGENNFTLDEIKRMLPDEATFYRILDAGIIKKTIDPNRYYLADSTPF